MLTQLLGGNNRFKNEFVNKFLTNPSEKVQATETNFENIKDILSQEHTRSKRLDSTIGNTYNLTGFMYKPDLLNKNQIGGNENKKENFSPIKNSVDSKNNISLQLSPNTHFSPKLLLKNKNPFIKETNHSFRVNTAIVRNTIAKIKILKENLKDSNSPQSRNVIRNNDIKVSSNTNRNPKTGNVVLQRKGHKKSLTSIVKIPVSVNEKNIKTNVVKVKPPKKLSNKTAPHHEHRERHLFEIKDLDKFPLKPNVTKLHKTPKVTQRLISPRTNPQPKTQLDQMRERQEDRQNGKPANDNISSSRVSFLSNHSIASMKINKKESSQEVIVQSESKQFIKNKYKTLLEHFSSI